MKAPAPTNISELRSFLGGIQYYQSFLPALSTELEPLHELLRSSNGKWNCSQRQQAAFESVEMLLQDALALVHYDSHKKIVVSCDASPYGLGGVLSRVSDYGRDQPIAYVSRKLTPAEWRYSQLDKEGLPVVFAV